MRIPKMGNRIRLYRMGKIYELNNEDGKARKIRIYPSNNIEVMGGLPKFQKW